MTFGILLYVNRSGSTLLSRLLSQASDDLFVFPELGFPLTLMLELRRGRVLAGEQLSALIRADPRQDALELSAADISDLCAELTSADLPLLLSRIATACHGRAPKAVLLKLESYLYVAEDLKRLLVDVCFIHLVRDPRAVTSSMLQTDVPEKPGFKMARGSIWYAAVHWRDYLEGVAALKRQDVVIELSYEALQRDAACGLAAVTEALGVSVSETPNDPGYRVAAIDAALHPRVFHDFEQTRLNAWREELRPEQARVVELLCGPIMTRYGYDLGRPTTQADRWLLRRTRSAHARAMMVHYWRTAAGYLRKGEVGALLRRGLLLAAKNGSR